MRGEETQIMVDSPHIEPAKERGADSYPGLYSRLFFVQEDEQEHKHVPLSRENLDSSQALVRLIAFYLPQFHQIPENDEWWGTGFTEWTNVRKARPNFAGHYQPRVPSELGYYDLSDIEVQKRQIELAKKYGIYGFCFYYYWFSGKRLLERPLSQFIETPEFDFPFCICWANENWTRRWDGAESAVLIGQTHSETDYAAFIRDVAPVLLDERYIRIEGKPLLAVYRINLLPSPHRAAEIWRAECRKMGVGEIYLVAIQSLDNDDPRPHGFDAAAEFPPHNCIVPDTEVSRSNLQIMNPQFTGKVFEYRVAAQVMLDSPVPDYTKFKTVMPSWDNTPRRQNTSDLFINATPAAYRHWLSRAVDYTCRHLPEDKRFLFINAWNEWGEGAYLEPDQSWGYAFLQATADAVRRDPIPENHKIIQSLRMQVEEFERLLVVEAARNEHLSHSVRSLEIAVRILSDQVNQMTVSELWKFGVILRQLMGSLFPPESRRFKWLRSVYRAWHRSPAGRPMASMGQPRHGSPRSDPDAEERIG